MKKVIIIVAILIMLTGGGVGVMKQFKLGPFAEGGDVASLLPKKKEKLVFLDMPSLTIPVLQGEQVAAVIQIELKLSTRGAKNEARLERLMPRLGDAFLRDLYGFLPRHLRKEERIDLDVVKHRLEVIGEEIAGQGIIADVLVQSIIDNPNR